MERWFPQAFLRKLKGEVPKNLRKRKRAAKQERHDKESEVRTLYVRSVLFRLPGADVTLAQPPQDQKKWNQRKHEKNRTTSAMDYAVNHLWANIYAEKPDYEDAKSVPQNGQRNDESDEHKPPPGRFQE